MSRIKTKFIENNAVTDAKIRQGSATSVIGRSANSTGNVADIAATVDGQYLNRAAGVLTWTALPAAPTLTSLGIMAGKTTITNGTTSQAVTFSTAYGSTGYSVTANLLNTTDTNPQFQPITITVQATTGFTATWNAPVGTANYVLSWHAILSN